MRYYEPYPFSSLLSISIIRNILLCLPGTFSSTSSASDYHEFTDIYGNKQCSGSVTSAQATGKLYAPTNSYDGKSLGVTTMNTFTGDDLNTNPNIPDALPIIATTCNADGKAYPAEFKSLLLSYPKVEGDTLTYTDCRVAGGGDIFSGQCVISEVK